MEKQQFCNHRTYGVGYAIRTKHRKSPANDLWMTTFDARKGKSWFLTRDFTEQDQVVFISAEQAKVLRSKKKKKPSAEKRKRVTFFDGFTTK